MLRAKFFDVVEHHRLERHMNMWVELSPGK